MHVYRQSIFFVRTKLPFSDWPALVDRYLEEQGLEYQNFLYYFECFDFSTDYRRVLSGEKCLSCHAMTSCESCRRNAQRGLRKQTGCERAAADCPALGPVVSRTEKGFTRQILTNLSSPGKAAHDPVLSLMKKIHRSYGFTETCLCYHGINFFSRTWPASVDASKQRLWGVDGPLIVLQRHLFSPRQSSILLQVEIEDGGALLDDSHYRDAMAALLPGVRCVEEITAELTPREQAELDQLQGRAEPLVKAASAFFAARFLRSSEKNGSGPVSLAPSLKRLCRWHSYRYIPLPGRRCSAEKQTANGHFLSLQFETGRMGDELNAVVFLEGPGFSQRIAVISYLPENRMDADTHLEALFSALDEAEAGPLAALDQLYPAGPAWYAAARAKRSYC